MPKPKNHDPRLSLDDLQLWLSYYADSEYPKGTKGRGEAVVEIAKYIMWIKKNIKTVDEKEEGRALNIEKPPGWRIGQTLYNFLKWRVGRDKADLFTVKDEELEELYQEFLKEYK